MGWKTEEFALNGQAVALSQAGRQPHNSRQSDAIAKKRQQPRAQMQTLGQHRCPSQEAQSRLGQRPLWAKGNIQIQETGLHSHSSVAILSFFNLIQTQLFPQTLRTEFAMDSEVSFEKPELHGTPQRACAHGTVINSVKLHDLLASQGISSSLQVPSCKWT